MPSAPAQESSRAARGGRSRQMASVPSLDLLLGAHPDSLRDIYLAGTAFDPTTSSQLTGGGETTARLLAIDALDSAYMLTRPLIVRLGSGWLPWHGTHFESGGTAGSQRLAAGRSWHFSAEAGPSRLDGAKTLRLRYGSLGNPRWVEQLEQELRRVGEQVVIGPLFRGDSASPSAWTGIVA